jgi:hypothetical protein
MSTTHEAARAAAWPAPAADAEGNVSAVVNYRSHYPGDPAGYVQFTRSAGRVFIVVDGTPVGDMPAEEFTLAALTVALGPADPRPVCANTLPANL